jgi:hypothetical protein
MLGPTIFAANVSQDCCLQARYTDCEFIRNDCEPDGFLIRSYRESKMPLVFKPKRLALQAATPSDRHVQND